MKQLSKTEFEKFIKAPVKEIKESQSIEVTADGAHIGFFVIGSEGAMRERMRGITSQADAGRGK